MMSDKISILFISDIHFGIRSIDQEEMAIAFAQTIFPLLSETDIFFINGDFFDTILPFDGHGFDPVYEVIMNLFHLCEHYQITLRLLQGTWGHDRNQLQRFEPFHRSGKYTFNFKYFGSMDLEEITIRDRTLRIGYVPDSLPFKSSEDVIEVFTDKMHERGWDDLDYMCMHGFFDFTYPKMISRENVIVYRESQFPFVKKMIDVGHVHQHQVSGKVISNGSFDRLCHGEEDAKCCLQVLDYPDHYTATFIKNTHAAIFNTIVFTKDDTTETIIERLTKHISSLKTNRKIYIRCVIEILEHRDAIKSWMKEVYPNIKCDIKTAKECTDLPSVIPNDVIVVPLEKRVAPTIKTIASFIRSHIPEEYVLSIDEIETYLEPVL